MLICYITTRSRCIQVLSGVIFHHLYYMVSCIIYRLDYGQHLMIVVYKRCVKIAVSNFKKFFIRAFHFSGNITNGFRETKVNSCSVCFQLLDDCVLYFFFCFLFIYLFYICSGCTRWYPIFVSITVNRQATSRTACIPLS